MAKEEERAEARPAARQEESPHHPTVSLPRRTQAAAQSAAAVSSLAIPGEDMLVVSEQVLSKEIKH